MDTVVVVLLLGLSLASAQRAWVFIPDSNRFYLYLLGTVMGLGLTWALVNGGWL